MLSVVLAYWLVGRRLVVEEQKGKRAAYGEHLLEHVSRELTAEFGKGFAEPQLRNCRLFYRAYPTETAIRYALRIKLSWTHHRAIMRVGDPKARDFYLREASERGLGAREIEREIRNCAYERVRANQIDIVEDESRSTDSTSPDQILKDPCVAEFLNLKGKLKGKEKKVEKRILDNILEFLLELGKGFSLVGRQVYIPTETSHKAIDLVFYNYILKCFVLIDLKTSKLNSRDIGQMDTYRRMYDALKKPEGDNPTIGILLGTEVDETDVKYSVMSECEQLFATKLMPYMPTKAELQFEIERARSRTCLRKRSCVKRLPAPKGGTPVTQTTVYKNCSRPTLCKLWVGEDGRGRSTPPRQLAKCTDMCRMKVRPSSDKEEAISKPRARDPRARLVRHVRVTHAHYGLDRGNCRRARVCRRMVLTGAT